MKHRKTQKGTHLNKIRSEDVNTRAINKMDSDDVTLVTCATITLGAIEIYTDLSKINQKKWMKDWLLERESNYAYSNIHRSYGYFDKTPGYPRIF